MKKNRTQKRFALALLAALFIGMVCGIVIQRNQVPRLIRRTMRSCLRPRASLRAARPAEKSISLKTRAFAFASDKDKYDTERDSKYTYPIRELDPRSVAVVLIDVWADNPNDGWQVRAHAHMKRTIVPLLELARRHGLAVVHSHNREPVAHEAKPLPGEFVVDPDNLPDDTAELDGYLKAHNIKTLLYAGYASNGCLLTRPTGILEMKRLGYDIILLRDCTLAVEAPETLDGEWTNKVMATTVEINWGSTATLKDLREAFGEKG